MSCLNEAVGSQSLSRPLYCHENSYMSLLEFFEDCCHDNETLDFKRKYLTTYVFNYATITVENYV